MPIAPIYPEAPDHGSISARHLGSDRDPDQLGPDL
jgi:hypothetical protein